MTAPMRLAAAAVLAAGLGCNPAGPGDEPPFEIIELRTGTGAEGA